MKHFSYLLVILLIFSACASQDHRSAKQKEIAAAVQQLGEEHYRNGNYTSALKHLLDAEKDLPEDPYLQNSLGLVYLAKNKPEMAKTHFTKALALKPDYTQALNNMGGVYMKQEQWDSAIRIYEQVVDSLLYATPQIPLSNLGWAYLNQNMFKQAEQYFFEALEIHPDFINAVHGLASLYMKQRNYTKAYAFIQKSIKNNPGAPILHADLAELYEVTGEPEKARKAWEVVDRLIPQKSSPLARKARERLHP